jgi:hypothetical protein
VKFIFRWAAGFCITQIFFADFDKKTKEVPTKISKKIFFFVPSKCQKTKEIFFITVLSFFYDKILFVYTSESLKRVKAITGQKQGNHTIHTVFFITVRTVMTLLTYCNEENRRLCTVCLNLLFCAKKKLNCSSKF